MYLLSCPLIMWPALLEVEVNMANADERSDTTICSSSLVWLVKWCSKSAYIYYDAQLDNTYCMLCLRVYVTWYVLLIRWRSLGKCVVKNGTVCLDSEYKFFFIIFQCNSTMSHLPWPGWSRTLRIQKAQRRHILKHAFSWIRILFFFFPEIHIKDFAVCSS